MFTVTRQRLQMFNTNHWKVQYHTSRKKTGGHAQLNIFKKIHYFQKLKFMLPILLKGIFGAGCFVYYFHGFCGLAK